MIVMDAAQFSAEQARECGRWYWRGVRLGALAGVTASAVLLAAASVAVGSPGAPAGSTAPRGTFEEASMAVADIPDLYDSGVPRAQTDLLRRVYQDAARKLHATLLKGPGTTAAARRFNQIRAAQLGVQIEAIAAKLKIDAAGWVGRNVADAARDGRERGEYQAAAMGLRPGGDLPRGSTALIDSRAIAVLARDAARDLYRAADGLAASGSRLLRATAQQAIPEADVARILAGGVALGEPTEATRELTAALRAVAGDRITIPLRSGGERSYEVGDYAEMVGRTKTRQATVLARHERLAELGLDLVRIVGRPSDNFCSAFLGQVFSLGGGHPRYPAYRSLPGGGPPFHPNCSKSTAPFVEELAGEAPALGDGPRRLLGVGPAEAQRRFRDLQLRGPSAEAYRRAGAPLAGPRRAAAAADFITDAEAGKLLAPHGVASVKLAGRAAVGDAAVPLLARAMARARVQVASVVVDAAPFRSARLAGQGGNGPLVYQAGVDRVSINPDWPHWNDVAGRVKDLRARNVWSSDDEQHPFLHELGHAKTHKSLGDADYARLRAKKFTVAESKQITADVSEGATGNALEFVAEVYAARLAGRKFPPSVTTRYTLLGGP